MKIKAFALASLVTLSIGALFAAGAISGDSVCGSSSEKECNLENLAVIFKGIFLLLLKFATAIMLIMISISTVQVMTAQDKAGALKTAKERMFNVVLGILIITLVGAGGYITFFMMSGINSEFLKPIKTIFGISQALLFPLPHAYAEGVSDKILPNPLGTDDLFTFIGSIIGLVMTWFVFPLIIFAWAYTGFQYVAAQGNPQKLVDAHKWLWWTVVGTVIIMLAKGLSAALQGTSNQLIS